MESTSSKTGDTGSTTRKDKGGDAPTFEPRKGKVLKHIKVGVWDLYVERDQLLSYLPTSWKIDAYTEMWNDLPYLWKAIRDLASVAWPMLSLYLVLAFAKSLLPALTLWCVRASGSPFDDKNDGILTALFFRYSGQLLSIVSIDPTYVSLQKGHSRFFFCRFDPRSTSALSTLVSSSEWSADGPSAPLLVASFAMLAAPCPPPSIGAAGSSTRRTFSTPWHASTSPHGKTLPFQGRSTDSSRVDFIPLHGQ